jgi:transposase
MHKISDEKAQAADEMFINGASTREVAKSIGISRGTAIKIQKMGRMLDFLASGNTRVNTGKKADGSISYYYTSEFRDHWEQKIYHKLKTEL